MLRFLKTNQPIQVLTCTQTFTCRRRDTCQPNRKPPNPPLSGISPSPRPPLPRTPLLSHQCPLPPRSACWSGWKWKKANLCLKVTSTLTDWLGLSVMPLSAALEYVSSISQSHRWGFKPVPADMVPEEVCLSWSNPSQADIRKLWINVNKNVKLIQTKLNLFKLNIQIFLNLFFIYNNLF